MPCVLDSFDLSQAVGKTASLPQCVTHSLSDTKLDFSPHYTNMPSVSHICRTCTWDWRGVGEFKDNYFF